MTAAFLFHLSLPPKINIYFQRFAPPFAKDATAYAATLYGGTLANYKQVETRNPHRHTFPQCDCSWQDTIKIGLYWRWHYIISSSLYAIMDIGFRPLLFLVQHKQDTTLCDPTLTLHPSETLGHVPIVTDKLSLSNRQYACLASLVR